MLRGSRVFAIVCRTETRRENGNDSIRRRNSLDHNMAPLMLTEERYISQWATRDSERGLAGDISDVLVEAEAAVYRHTQDSDTVLE